MEEGGVIAFAGEQPCDAGIGVHRCRCEDEGFYEHGYAAEYRRHAVDGFLSVGKGIREGEALSDELVYVGRVSLVGAAVEVFVQSPDVFPSETLDDDDDDVRPRVEGCKGVTGKGIEGVGRD